MCHCYDFAVHLDTDSLTLYHIKRIDVFWPCTTHKIASSNDELCIIKCIFLSIQSLDNTIWIYCTFSHYSCHLLTQSTQIIHLITDHTTHAPNSSVCLPRGHRCERHEICTATEQRRRRRPQWWPSTGLTAGDFRPPIACVLPAQVNLLAKKRLRCVLWCGASTEVRLSCAFSRKRLRAALRWMKA